MANNSLFPIEKMCKVLKVSRSSYYCWLIRKPGKRDIENDELSDRIKKIYETSKRTYGSPRVTIALLEEGVYVSRPRVARLMKKQNLQSSLTMDQYNQDQNVYLHHVEHKDSLGLSVEDGLTINSRPDWKGIKEEYSIYNEMNKLSPHEREALRLKSLQAGKISTRRAFYGVRRGTINGEPYDDAGLFLKNKWGNDAIKIYVDKNLKPHFEIYDSLGKAVVYNIKIP